MQGDENSPIQLQGVTVTPATKTSQQGIDLISHFEGLRLEAYQDSVGIWTVGIGSTFYEDNSRVKKGDIITKERAISLFKTVLQRFESTVLKKIKRPLLQREFDALVSFTYNAGTGYTNSSGHHDYDIFKNVQNMMPPEQIKTYWESLAVTAGGKRLEGLVRRRKAEVHLYNTGELKFY